MLQAKTTPQGFEIKNSQQKLSLADKVIELADTTINRPGEYEAGGIEVIYGQAAALIVWDKLQIVYVFSLDKTTAFEKSQFSPCDIVIFSQSLALLKKAAFNEALEMFDPNLVVVSAKNDLTEVQGLVKTPPSETAKFAAQFLPEEGREFIVLS